MYILLTKQNTVAEIIPDYNPAFPTIPIEKRYTKEFISKLLYFTDDTLVEQNWTYDPETETFHAPVEIVEYEPEEYLQ